MGCPGYASYSIHGNGLVEVNGVVPAFSSESTKARVLEAWDKFGPAISSAAGRYGFPAPWLLGILMQESNGGKLDCSPCSACPARHCSTHLGKTCCAFTIMQFLPTTAAAQGTSIELMMQDDTLAIMTGGKLLSKLLARYNGDIVKAAASYNAGSPVCNNSSTTFGYRSNGDYPMDVVKWANTATNMKLLPNKSLLGVAFVAAGVFTAGIILADIWKPKWL